MCGWIGVIEKLYMLTIFGFTVEGVVASLRTGRNCIAISSAALKLYAQRQVMARLIEEEEEEGDNQEDTN